MNTENPFSRVWNVSGKTWLEARVPGPWAVDNSSTVWKIINTETGRTKTIGPVKFSGSNNFDKAMQEATRRNEELQKTRNEASTKVRIIVETINDAFVGELKYSEVARIVAAAAELVWESPGTHVFHDVNGGKVGFMSVDQNAEALVMIMDQPHVAISLVTGNEAFSNGKLETECARILNEAALTIRGGDLDFKLRDGNGNVVGQVVEQNTPVLEKPVDNVTEIDGNGDHVLAGPGLYAELLAAGIEMDSHESDLYVPVTKESTAILAKYPTQKSNATTFKSAIDGVMNYDVPFAYVPYWEKKSAKAAERVAMAKSSFDHVDIALDRKYEGNVLGVTDAHVVLSLGPSALIIRKADIDRVPETGEYMAVKFSGGKGLVEPVKAAGIER